MADESDSGRGFKVQDRRRFTVDGEARAEHEPAATSNEAPPQAAPDSSSPEPPPPPRAEPDAGAAQINFSTFVISLGTQALAYLGEIPNPIDHSATVDLTAAKEMIDIVALLRDKTKGNLDEGENALMDGLLYDLRLKYVERVRGASKRS